MNTSTPEEKLVAEPADALVREEALDPERSFIVQAPAGSGKTELLTRRVLTLLTRVDEPEEVLAITFTRKAAHEMRNRVIEMLVLASTTVRPSGKHEQAGFDLASAVLKRDEAREWGLIKNPQRLNMRTIDALNTTLAHRLPLVSGLGTTVGTVEKAMPLYMQAAERLIEDSAASIDLLLMQLGNKHESVQRLMAELLGNRDQWLRIAFHGLDEDELREHLETMLQQLVASRLESLNSAFPESTKELLPTLLAHMARVSPILIENGMKEPPNLEALTNVKAMPGANIEDLEAWEGIANLMLVKGKPATRQKVSRLNGFPNSKKDADLLDTSVSELNASKDAMTAQLRELDEHSAALGLLDEVRQLPSGVYKDEDWALLAQVLGSLKALIIELQLVFAERGQVDFVEMALRAQQALGTEDEPTDLALSLDMRIRHVLVDEFQDTSRTQFELYKLLVAGWQPGDGCTFFAVGDPMQSIYRFRDGDVTLFNLAQQSGIGQVSLHPLSLSVNFRASADVVNWINATFKDVFPEKSDDITGAVPYAHSDAFHDRPGKVQLHGMLDESVEAEAAQVAMLAAQSISEADPATEDTAGRVAILLRSRSQAAPIFEALQSQGIAYQSVDMELLGNRRVVVDIESLCLALRYPHDRLHWLALLRAPWCGLTLQDLHALMHESKQLPVIALLQDQKRIALLTQDAQERVARFLEVISPAIQRTSRDALVPWVQACWLQLGGPVLCTDSVDIDAAQRCFARLGSLEQAGELWQPSVLREAMESLYASSAENEQAPVQIMTLHKSKGLEFDTVILPALDRKAPQEQQRALNWFEAGRDADAFLLLAPVGERGLSGDNRDRIYALVRKARQRCEAQEKQRVLYVACTRAKRKLHLLARYKTKKDGEIAEPASNSLLASLVDQFHAMPALNTVSDQTAEVDVGAAAVDMVDTDVNSVNDTTMPQAIPKLEQMPANWRVPEIENYVWPGKNVRKKLSDPELEFSWAGTVARDIGNVVHDQLQLLGAADIEQRMALCANQDVRVERALRNMGVTDEQLPSAVQQALKGLNNTLEDDRGQWILDQQHTEAHSEWALTAAIEGDVIRIVIDRTFVDADGTRWIVDFKTGDHKGSDVDAFLDREEERYTAQLLGYADIMKRIDKRPIRMGLYFPMLKAWREVEQDADGHTH